MGFLKTKVAEPALVARFPFVVVEGHPVTDALTGIRRNIPDRSPDFSKLGLYILGSGRYVFVDASPRLHGLSYEG